MPPRLRQSLLVRVYTTPGPNGLSRPIYHVHNLKTGEEMQFTNWEELRAYLERVWPRQLR